MLVCCIKCGKFAKLSLQVSMRLKKNKFSLNLDQTKLKIFYRQEKKIRELNITINGTSIERVQSLNFLGIT